MSTIIDGRAIARDILADVGRRVAELTAAPRLTVFTCAPDFATQKFLALKKRQAEQAGVRMNVVEFSPELSIIAMQQSIAVAHAEADGIIVQLPFPDHFSRRDLLSAIQPSHDIDVFYYQGEQTKRLPPVIGAIAEIADTYNIAWAGTRVVVVGRGLLVGTPAALFAASAGAEVQVIDKSTVNSVTYLRSADIIISGAGVSHFITPDMVKDGVVVFDAGTSEDNGILAGDVHPDVANKASVFTPVPGGIGPITVAVLLRNLITPLGE